MTRQVAYLTSWGLPTDAAAQLLKCAVDTYILSFAQWDASGTIQSSDGIADVPKSAHCGQVSDLLKKSASLFTYFNVMTYDAGKQFFVSGIFKKLQQTRR